MAKINRINYQQLLNYTAQSKIPHELFIDLLSWSDLIKSPYGLSFYSAPVDWNYKEDKSFRISDHWNFYTRHSKDMHCKTNINVPKNTWSLGQYNAELGMYEILKNLQPLNYKLGQSTIFKLLSIDIQYSNVIEKNSEHKAKIEYSFLKKYYTVLEEAS